MYAMLELVYVSLYAVVIQSTYYFSRKFSAIRVHIQMWLKSFCQVIHIDQEQQLPQDTALRKPTIGNLYPV